MKNPFPSALLAALQIREKEAQRRRALSLRFPLLKKPIIAAHRGARRLRDFFNPEIRRMPSQKEFFPQIVVRHQSPLRRKLAGLPSFLTEGKIANLRHALESLDGLVISPGQTFSFWREIGEPSRQRGFVDGPLLAGGKLVTGAGGGLCQLSNFLFWILLHAPTEVVERHHHSHDAFPDSGRTLPFGSGATVLFNWVDLRLRNVAEIPLQLRLWLTDDFLKGQLRAPTPIAEKFHIVERDHLFLEKDRELLRFNEIFREKRIAGQLLDKEKIATNLASVIYKTSAEELQEQGFRVLRFS